jgi:hypothetical protein
MTSAQWQLAGYRPDPPFRPFASWSACRRARQSTHFLFQFPAMTKLCTFVGMFVGSYAGWFIAAPLGFWWAFIVSGIGSVVGVYLGWKLARHLER